MSKNFASVDSLVELFVAVLPEAVTEHDRVDPADLGGLVHELNDVAIVAGEAEELGLLRLLHPLPHLDVLLVEELRVLDEVHEVEIEVVHLELLEAGVEVLGVGLHRRAAARALRGDPDVLPLHLLNERREGLVALSALIDQGSVEVVDSFTKTPMQHLVVLRIKDLRAAKEEDGDGLSCRPELPPRDLLLGLHLSGLPLTILRTCKLPHGAQARASEDALLQEVSAADVFVLHGYLSGGSPRLSVVALSPTLQQEAALRRATLTDRGDIDCAVIEDGAFSLADPAPDAQVRDHERLVQEGDLSEDVFDLFVDRLDRLRGDRADLLTDNAGDVHRVR
mgnify:CR=1 FL=1